MSTMMAQSIIDYFKGANLTQLIWQFNMQTMTSTNLAAKLAHTCRLRPFQSPQSRYIYSSLCCWRTPGVPECIRAQAESTHWYLVKKLKRATIENFSWNWMSKSAMWTSYLCRCPLWTGNHCCRSCTGQVRLLCSQNTHCRRLRKK